MKKLINTYTIIQSEINKQLEKQTCKQINLQKRRNKHSQNVQTDVQNKHTIKMLVKKKHKNFVQINVQNKLTIKMLVKKHKNFAQTNVQKTGNKHTKMNNVIYRHI